MTDDIQSEDHLRFSSMLLEYLVHMIRSNDPVELRISLYTPIIGDSRVHERVPVLTVVERDDKGEISSLKPVAELLGHTKHETLSMYRETSEVPYATTIINTEEESKCLTQQTGETLEPSPESFFISNSERRH